MEMAFTPGQVTALRDFMRNVMQSASDETMQSLTQSQTGLTNVMQQMTAQQEEMKKVMNEFDIDKVKIKEVMEKFQADSGGMMKTMTEIESKLGILDLEGVDRKVGSLVASLTEARTNALATLRESYSSKLEETESKFKVIDDTLTKAHGLVAGIERKVEAIEQAMQSGNFGSGKGKGGGGYAGDRQNFTGLVDMRDVKLPMFPEGSPTVAVFRKWWNELMRYCSMREGEWRAADVIFRVIRGYPNEIDHKEFAQFGNVCAKRDAAQQGNHFQYGGFNNIQDKSKDMFACLEHSLNGKCAEMIGVIKNKDGFELLRKLARKYDPISPQAASIYKARVFAHAGHACANFGKTVDRLNALEMLRCEMIENTGEDMKDENLADVFFPTMDASCQSEIVALKVNIGFGEDSRPVDTSKFEDLAEYVKERIFRERTLVPIASHNRMDVSSAQAGPSFGPDNYGVGASAGHNGYGNWDGYGPQSGTDAHMFGGESSHWDWDSQGCSHDLDAMRMKGKGKGWVGNRVLDCHNCGGEGHPKRLCPSPVNPDPNSARCSNCKGLAHSAKDCTSPGGGKFVPFEKGKGKGDKGKGGGKNQWRPGKGQGGPSKHFFGKGSGGVSSMEEWGQYSTEQWNAWNQQQGWDQGWTQQQQQWSQQQQQQQWSQQQQQQAATGTGGSSAGSQGAKAQGAAAPWMTGAGAGAAPGGASGVVGTLRSLCQSTVGDG